MLKVPKTYKSMFEFATVLQLMFVKDVVVFFIQVLLCLYAWVAFHMHNFSVFAPWQIGSRITSARIQEMLEHSFPCSYIMVDNHPRRHDPLHIVTHRIRSTSTEFTNYLLKACSPYLCSKWNGYLRALDMMVSDRLSGSIVFLCHRFFKLFL